MKKIFKFFSLLIFYFLLNKNALAFEFIKLSDNPLTVSYIDNYANQLQANIFKEEDIYKGIFSINRPPENYYSLGYFESTNGIDWQMKKEILNTGEDLSNPSVIKTETGYLLFVSRYDSRTIYRIYSSICDLDFNCSSNLTPVITPDINNYTEKNGVFAGRPFQQNNRTYLFFGVWGGDGFKIKLAYSDDLVTWERCQNAFLQGGDGPFPYQENNNLYLFFHQSNNSGIKLSKTSLPLSCNSEFVDQGYLLTKDKTYDQKHLVFPSVLNDNGGLKLYYSGLGSDSRWRLNLACTGQACLLPTSTPTPTPTLIPTLTPIIIIPGFMASWNKDAILHNADKSQSEWKLNPIVTEFDGIINTLKNLGYAENNNLFVFTYDWRKPVLNIVDDLNSFITNHQSLQTNFQIVGHSLGGLVARIYSQKYNNENNDKLITVGSPHNGVTVAYKIVESGEIERFNDYLWLATKMILILNKNNLETNKQTLSRLIPVMKDLFPVYNFLKNDGVEINVADMKIKNELLPHYNANLTNWTHKTNLTTIVGEKGNTLKGFNVENQTVIDKLLDNYPDGRPHSSFSEIGDYTVLSFSAAIGTPVILNLGHNELIYKKEGIKKILDLLSIKHEESQIVEGKGTTIDRSLIFLIRSPAIMTVEFNNNIYKEYEGMIFVPGAQSGSYNLKVQGTDQGKYEVIIGQISENNDIWESINGEIIQSPASSQIDNYLINYNSQTALSIFSPLRPTGFEGQATPTITPTVIPTLTPTVDQISTLIPTIVLKSTNSSPGVLGTSSSQEELITPAIVLNQRTEAKKEIEKTSIWDYLWPTIASLILGGIGYIFRKKILRK